MWKCNVLGKSISLPQFLPLLYPNEEAYWRFLLLVIHVLSQDILPKIDIIFTSVEDWCIFQGFYSFIIHWKKERACSLHIKNFIKLKASNIHSSW